MKKRKKFFLGCAFVCTASLSGCATTGQSIGAGATSGGILGAGVGALADPGQNGGNRIRNVLIGTAAGAIVGAGTGYATNEMVKGGNNDAYQKGKTDSQKEQAQAAASSGINPPKLVPPKTEARWIPDQARGSVFVPGHFEYVIIEGARWEPSR